MNAQTVTIILLGGLSSLSWGTYVVILKLSTHSGRGSPPQYAISFVLGMLILSFISIFPYQSHLLGLWLTPMPCLIAVTSGILWMIGMYSVILALYTSDALVSKLSPIYNSNTVISVLLAMIFLGEASDRWPMYLMAAVMVMIAGWLVTESESTDTTNKYEKRWIRLAIVAAFMWGFNTVLNKLAIVEDLSFLETLFLMSLGGFIASIGIYINSFYRRVGSTTGLSEVSSNTSIILNKNKETSHTIIKGSFVSGLVCGLGYVSFLNGIQLGIPVSILVPIANTNTLVTFLLGLFILKERGKIHTPRILIAVFLVIIASFLVSI